VNPGQCATDYQQQGAIFTVAKQNSGSEFSADERASDSRADAMSAVVLVAIAVATVIYWLSGQ
jgi:hypothetical protein